MPLRHVIKVLEKFSLRIDNPRAFDYKKISTYLTTCLKLKEEAYMLNPSKVIREITLEVNFTPAHLKAVQASPTIVYPMLKAQNKVF